MAQYYFLGTSLPPLAIGDKPAISFQEFRDLLRANLTPSDWEQFTDLLRLIDLSNIRALWLGTPFDERGNLQKQTLEEALLVKEGLPECIHAYLAQYEDPKDRLRFFPSLYTALCLEMQEKYPAGFLHAYYQFEREIRLVLTALRAKYFGKNLLHELQFEDPTDPFVAEIIAQKDGQDYHPPEEFESLKALFTRCVDKPKELFKALLEYRFAALEESAGEAPFSIDTILGYAARLLLVESWDQLSDGKKGTQIIEHLG